MEDISIEVSGLAELQKQLEKLGGQAAKDIVRDGLREGGDALRGAMMVSTASAFSGEPAAIARNQKSWSRSVKMYDDLSGVTRVGPKGKLPPLHKSYGHGMQPKDKIYRRSLAYLIKLCEFGASGGKERGALGRKTPMTSGFESYKGAVLERVVSVIKERLKLS